MWYCQVEFVFSSSTHSVFPMLTYLRESHVLREKRQNCTYFSRIFSSHVFFITVHKDIGPAQVSSRMILDNHLRYKVLHQRIVFYS